MTSVVSWRRPPKRRLPNTKCTLLRYPQGRSRGVAASVSRARGAPGTAAPTSRFTSAAFSRSCSGYTMCCQAQPPHAPRPGSASGPKWMHRARTRCGEARRISSRAGKTRPLRPGSSLTRTRSPGMVKGTAMRRRPADATPSPAAFSSAISTSMIFEPTSFDIQELDVEDERRVRGNYAACALRAIAKLRRDGEHALSADSHAGYALVPPGNHLARAETERKRLVAITRAVELASLVIGTSLVVQPAGVVHLYLPSRYGLRASASLGVLPHQLSDIRMSHVVSATRSRNTAEQKSHKYRGPGAHRTPRIP